MDMIGINVTILALVAIFKTTTYTIPKFNCFIYYTTKMTASE